MEGWDTLDEFAVALPAPDTRVIAEKIMNMTRNFTVNSYQMTVVKRVIIGFLRTYESKRLTIKWFPRAHLYKSSNEILTVVEL
jgi:hypothetical protein